TARPDDGKFYTRLTAATDFFASEIGLKVKKYLDALSVIPDETLRLKTAISQAKKLDGVTNEQLSATFFGLQTAKQAEKEKFDKAMAAFTQAEITDRTAKIDELKALIAKTNEDMATELLKLSDAQNAVSSNT